MFQIEKIRFLFSYYYDGSNPPGEGYVKFDGGLGWTPDWLKEVWICKHCIVCCWNIWCSETGVSCFRRQCPTKLRALGGMVSL